MNKHKKEPPRRQVRSGFERGQQRVTVSPSQQSHAEREREEREERGLVGFLLGFLLGWRGPARLHAESQSKNGGGWLLPWRE
jgi:hypothetical protein